jgi:hypothetical protein
MSGKLPFLPPPCALIRYTCRVLPFFTTKERAFSVSGPKSGHALEHNSEFQNYSNYEVNYVQACRNFSLGFSNEEGRPGVARGQVREGGLGAFGLTAR